PNSVIDGALRDRVRRWLMTSDLSWRTLPTPDDSPVQTVEALKKTVEDILARHGVRHTIEWYVSGEPFYTPPGELSQAAVDAISAVTGAAPQLSTGGGTSDGRFIAPLGAQVVELGVTNATIHKVNECVRIEEIGLLHRMYRGVLDRLLA
ncbi:MAG: M20/M25/M40 family metallo-hydrolase, partial [Proteobacteria bacterium]|nr:M20/M25/M40 family metallo-hydrolase [Pseudomonadota bacterium]